MADQKQDFGIVAFAFGTPATAAPNVRIASIAARLARKYSKPIFTQDEVQFEKGSDLDVTRIEGEEVPTLRIARAAVAWAVERKLHHLWVVCAKPHWVRCERDLKEAAAEAGVKLSIFLSPEIEASSRREWFDPNSTQKRVRSTKAWLPREVLLCVMPFWLYKRLAS